VPPPEPELSLTIIDLMGRVRFKVIALFCRFRIPPEETEELLQETLFALFASWDRIESREGYLLGTLRNRCRVYLRQCKRRRLVPVDPAALIELAPAVPPAQEERIAILDLARLCEPLSPRERRTLRVTYRLGLEDEEAAPIFGIAPESLRTYRHRLLRRLRRAAERQSA
jgi:RNA polymerase sigma factor (sigma-70 family)